MPAFGEKAMENLIEKLESNGNLNYLGSYGNGEVHRFETLTEWESVIIEVELHGLNFVVGCVGWYPHNHEHIENFTSLNKIMGVEKILELGKEVRVGFSEYLTNNYF